MFHLYFVGSAEGLLFDVPRDDYDGTLWGPLGAHLHGLGVEVAVGREVTTVLDGAGGRLAVHHRAAGGGDPGQVLDADAVVLALDPVGLREVVAGSPRLGGEDDAGRAWREQVAGGALGPRVRGLAPLARRAGSGPSGRPSSARAGTARSTTSRCSSASRTTRRSWSSSHGGSVVELHAYALPDGTDEADLRERMLAALHRVYPETAGLDVVHEEWLVERDCVLVGLEPWASRPGVATPDPRLVLAGDAVRCDLPVALMERAATTGWLAADRLLTGWGLPGHGVWSVPLTSRLGRVPALARRGLRAYRSARSG